MESVLCSSVFWKSFIVVISDKKSPVILILPLYIMCLYPSPTPSSQVACNSFCLSLVLSNLVTTYLGVVFLCLGVHWAEICGFLLFTTFGVWVGNISPLFFQIFFGPPLGTQFTYISGCLKLSPQLIHTHFSFFFPPVFPFG